jgi:hypothetical protein
VYAVLVPPEVSVPDTSSRHLAAAAIMARALSFTEDGAWPSAQLTVLSAVALVAAVFDHFQKDIKPPKQQRPLVGAAGVLLLGYAET